MILQDLAAYYERLADDPEENVAGAGFQSKEIAFVVVLRPDGSLAGIDDTRYLEGKKKRVRVYKVPREEKRTIKVIPNLLWDNPAYVFGEEAVKKGKEPRKPKRLAEMRAAFVQRIREAFPEPVADPGVAAVLAFLNSDQAGLRQHPLWPELLESGLNLSFRLEGEVGLVCQGPAVRAALATSPDQDRQPGLCLVSGRREPIARLHTAIKGVWGGNSRGGDIVSFNKPAFCSQGKEQGDNSPVGLTAEFAYTTALNHLLRKDSPQRMQVGDASTVFWAAQANPMEGIFGAMMGGDEVDGLPVTLDNVMAIFNAPRTGRPPLRDDPTGFYVLGLSPNAARIAVRFWYRGSVAEISRNLLAHFQDLEIVRAPHDKPSLSIFRLLTALAVLGKADNIPPNLAGKLYESIIKGLPYPASLLPAALTRLRAEREITHPRAALIKAWLNRRARYYDLPEKELTVALDLENQNVGYRLGRLFAVLERAQELAQPGINATIRERFYGAASATPVVAFPRLLKLKNHHLAKIENPGVVVKLEKLLGEISGGLDAAVGFPSRLDLADQGRFAIGYYHQRQDFFKKRAQAEDLAEASDTAQSAAVAAE
ncbi:MAG: type I-C CRISPR-associated protein Cas8c/Csd1 [Desulfarculus sp.]|nr:type I-C CRISPR-associated protein Cas8c/Csd1 [Desulfarculus sp.]